MAFIETGENNPMATTAITAPRALTTVFLPLGKGQCRAAGVSQKAVMLDIAKVEALPVPNGLVILSEVYDAALASGLLQINGTSVVCPDPSAFIAALGLPAFPAKGKVSVRAAFSIEETPNIKAINPFSAQSGIDPTKAKALADAIVALYTQALPYAETDFRRDILILEQPEATTSGVIVTEAHYEDDTVISSTGERAFARKLRAYEKGEREEGTPRASATYVDRAQALSRRVRTQFGAQNWEIEFADTGTSIALMQVRSLPTVSLRDDEFTLGLFQEVLPPLPSYFTSALIESCSEAVYDAYRQLHNSLPVGRPLIKRFQQRPYFNASLQQEIMSALGLPQSLVTEGASGRILLRRLIVNLPSIASLSTRQINAARNAQTASQQIIALSRTRGQRFSEVIATLKQVIVKYLTETLNLNLAIAAAAGLASAKGIAQLVKALGSSGMRFNADLAALRDYAHANPALLPTLAKGEAPADPEFNRRLTLFLANHGHQAAYGLDVAEPRFKDQLAPVLRAVAAKHAPKTARKGSTDGLGQVERQIYSVLVARDQLRDDTLLAIARLRDQLLKLAQAATEAGNLPDALLMWQLTPEELALVDVGWVVDLNFIVKRGVEIAALRDDYVPHTLRMGVDLNKLKAPRRASYKAFTGAGVVAGTISGKAWVVSDPSRPIPANVDPAHTILVAPTVDLGWLPLLSSVAGVVIEQGGAFSTGAVLLRELKLPAVVGVADATRLIQADDSLTLNGATGNVTRQ